MKKKLLKSKIAIIIVILCFIAYFSNDFMLIALQKTAIITAIGLDLGENGDINATLQIAVPQATDNANENKKAVVTGKGKTVAEAVQEVGDITGWYPKLSFCNLIILGENFLQRNVNEYIDYFSKSTKVQDSAVIASCLGKAENLLKDATPLDNLTSFAIQKILIKNTGMTNDVATVSIKDFSVGYYSRSGSSYMPLIQKERSAESDKTNSNAKQSSAGEGKAETYCATTTILFKNGIAKGSFNEKQTQAFNLVTKSVKETAYAVNGVIYENESIDFLLHIISNEHKLSLKIQNGLPTLKVKTVFNVKIEDQNGSLKKLNFLDNGVVPKIIIDRATEDFKKTFNEILQICNDLKVDALKLDDLLYKYNNQYYNSLKDTIYNNLIVDYNITFKSIK